MKVHKPCACHGRCTRCRKPVRGISSANAAPTPQELDSWLSRRLTRLSIKRGKGKPAQGYQQLITTDANNAQWPHPSSFLIDPRKTTFFFPQQPKMMWSTYTLYEGYAPQDAFRTPYFDQFAEAIHNARRASWWLAYAAASAKGVSAAVLQALKAKTVTGEPEDAARVRAGCLFADWYVQAIESDKDTIAALMRFAAPLHPGYVLGKAGDGSGLRSAGIRAVATLQLGEWKALGGADAIAALLCPWLAGMSPNDGAALFTALSDLPMTPLDPVVTSTGGMTAALQTGVPTYVFDSVTYSSLLNKGMTAQRNSGYANSSNYAKAASVLAATEQQLTQMARVQGARSIRNRLDDLAKAARRPAWSVLSCPYGLCPDVAAAQESAPPFHKEGPWIDTQVALRWPTYTEALAELAKPARTRLRLIAPSKRYGGVVEYERRALTAARAFNKEASGNDAAIGRSDLYGYWELTRIPSEANAIANTLAPLGWKLAPDGPTPIEAQLTRYNQYRMTPRPSSKPYATLQGSQELKFAYQGSMSAGEQKALLDLTKLSYRRLPDGSYLAKVNSGQAYGLEAAGFALASTPTTPATQTNPATQQRGGTVANGSTTLPEPPPNQTAEERAIYNVRLAYAQLRAESAGYSSAMAITPVRVAYVGHHSIATQRALLQAAGASNPQRSGGGVWQFNASDSGEASDAYAALRSGAASFVAARNAEDAPLWQRVRGYALTGDGPVIGASPPLPSSAASEVIAAQLLASWIVRLLLHADGGRAGLGISSDAELVREEDEIAAWVRSQGKASAWLRKLSSIRIPTAQAFGPVL